MSSLEDSSGARLFWLIIAAAFFPPLAVTIEFGFCTTVVFWNIVLSLLIPFAGFAHAVYYLCEARYHRLQRAGYESVPEGVVASETLVLPVPAQGVSHNSGSGNHSQRAGHESAAASEPLALPSPESSNRAFSSEPSAEVPAENPPPYTTMDNKIQR